MKKRTILIGTASAIALLASGCASIQSAFNDMGGIDALDAAYQQWAEQYREAGNTIGNDPAVVEDSATIPDNMDAIPFSSLVWRYGGFPGGTARLSDPRIGAFRVSGDKMSFKWDVNLSAWGLANDDAEALACLFCRVSGSWRGGKFEWISSSRTTRDFGNIRDGYGGWVPSDLDRADAFAFVVVSKDGKRRSNIALYEK